jgi:hypothetical protein
MPRPIDWALAGSAAVAALAVLGFPLVGSRFASMYSEMQVELPLMTSLASSAWFPPLVALVFFALIGIGLALGHKLGGRLPWIAAALVGALGAVPALLVASYYPIFQLASEVR